MKNIIELTKKRPDFRMIFDWVTPDSKVLDIGCGSGDLLDLLKTRKNVSGHGLEIDTERIYACLEKDVSVIQANIEDGLPDFGDQSYDYVILNQTLQVTKHSERILHEITRVGKKAIVSIPNFGFWWFRCLYFFKGKMPVSNTLPYEWYNTPNIHLASIKDFKLLCEHREVNILREAYFFQDHHLPNLRVNWFADTAVFLLGKSS